MFTITEREALRAKLIEAARDDERITGAAQIGSAALGTEDRWSDIDLSFGVRADSDVDAVLQAFTQIMDRDDEVVHALDISSGRWRQRVFLLANTLQVDLAFAPEDRFGAQGPAFGLLFGRAIEPVDTPPTDSESLTGWAWLYALQVRSALVRNRRWQAELMLNRMRDQVLALACVRHGLPTRDGRGLDALPETVRGSYEGTRIQSLAREELNRAFGVTIDLLLEDIRVLHPALAERLGPTLRQIGRSGEH